jgi:hypothetical protein
VVELGSNLLRPIIAIGVLSLATTAFADPTPVDGDSLKKSIPGSLVEIDTPLGAKMPIRFSADGLFSAEAGDLAPILGSPKDRGRWWVEGDKLCSKFFRWFDAESRCITLARDGSRLYWRKDDGETGTATLVEQATPDAPVSAAAIVATADAPASKAVPRKVEAAEIQTASEAENSGSGAASVPQATVVASAEATPTAAPPQGPPTMKFGGTALLDASSRVGPQGPVRPLNRPASQKDGPQRAAQAKPDTPKKLAKKETVVAQLPTTRGLAAPPWTAAKATPPGRVPTASDMFAVAEGTKTRDVAASSSAAAFRYRVTGVQAGDVLNVRRGPSEEHEQIGGIPPKGRSVEIVGRCYADWCPVRYGKIRGWVNSYYLVAEGTRIGSSSPVYVAKP